MKKLGREVVAWVVVALAVVTAPVWMPAAVVWLICTGRSLRSVGLEANAMSGMVEVEG